MGVGDGGDQAIGPFDRHIHIGGQILGPVDMVTDQPHAGRCCNQLVAFGIAAHIGQQRWHHAEPAQGHRDIHRHAAGQAGDPPGHVGPHAHMAGGAPDHVPQDRSDA